MNILLDFLPFMHDGCMRGIGGATSFAKAISDEVIKRKKTDDYLFAVYDSTMSSGQQYNYISYAQANNIQLLDIAKVPIAQHIKEFSIDVFFIAIGQFFAPYNLHGIECKVIMFIHDIADIERTDNGIDLLLRDYIADKKWQWAKRCLNLFIGRWNRQNRKQYDNIMSLYAAPNTLAYTVSYYSSMALRYYFPKIKKEIHICFSPAKEVTVEEEIECPQLKQIIQQGKKYILILAANRRYKNIYTFKKVFARLISDYPDLHLVTLKYGHIINPQHIDIPFLSDSDLEHAYKNAYALYFGSFFEGFGYPPLEAMKYGTPTIASNVTSIPEILGNAGIYFSPIYPADLYRAIIKVLQERDFLKEVLKMRYQEVYNRQKDNLKKVVDEILNIQ